MPNTRMQIVASKTRNVMSQCQLELCGYSINSILRCSKCLRNSAYQYFFFKYCFNNLCFQSSALNVTLTDEITRVTRHK